MPSTTVHIINHTHWDREWFLTSIYTSQWIPGLVDILVGIVQSNPKFRYFLDGQTLVIEDLLALSPEYESIIEKLSSNGNLSLGPYYCQPDWQLTGGEALLRNLYYGQQDMTRHKSNVAVGWLVDTFGHISQSPQIHCLFGIDAVYVWRGVPKLQPFFQWQGADGCRLFTVNLFGGYRNLYGVTHTPEIAVRRLRTEVRKLSPYYPTADIPLFDGYDLEIHPEDPVRFFEQLHHEIPPEIQLRESSPQDFVKQVRPKLPILPVIEGELNSGKYGATFPGTLSTRTYLKIMSRDCETLLYQVCEPLAVLATLKGRPYPSEQFEQCGRVLLQNAVHDCICGVSIDQVHEKMEYNFRRIFDLLLRELRGSVGTILGDFAPGIYAVSTNPFPYEGWQVIGDRLFHLKTGGVGVWPVENSVPVALPSSPVETYSWQNDHYSATMREDGTVMVGEAVLGRLVVSKERGDAYSEEPGDQLGVCQSVGPILVEGHSDHHCVLCYPCRVVWGEILVTATVRILFDRSPLIRWQIALDSRGTDFRIDLVYETAHQGQVYAGMPFDTVERPVVDDDLLPRQLDENLEKVLLGQRELGQVRTFPFHDFVAIAGDLSTVAILAQGTHAYQVNENGVITLQLRRAIEWLTRSNLEFRVGDAGPFFYVPDGRCERIVTHELGVFFTAFGVDDTRFYALQTGFQNPPLVVQSGGCGSRRQWQFFGENLPLSSLQLYNDQVLARFFNPTSKPLALSRPRMKTDMYGRKETLFDSVPAKGIMTVAVESSQPDPGPSHTSSVNLLNEPVWRVGPNKGTPDPGIIQGLKDKINGYQNRLEEISEALEAAEGNSRYLLQHQAYVLERELLEYRLSVRLNEIKLAKPEKDPSVPLFKLDEEVAAIGWQLNQLRIKRRIYDYIIQTI